jgi:hypothetical protein
MSIPDSDGVPARNYILPRSLFVRVDPARKHEIGHEATVDHQRAARDVVCIFAAKEYNSFCNIIGCALRWRGDFGVKTCGETVWLCFWCPLYVNGGCSSLLPMRCHGMPLAVSSNSSSVALARSPGVSMCLSDRHEEYRGSVGVESCLDCDVGASTDSHPGRTALTLTRYCASS